MSGYKQLISRFFDFLEFDQRPLDEQRLWIMETLHLRFEIHKIGEWTSPALVDDRLAALVTNFG